MKISATLNPSNLSEGLVSHPWSLSRLESQGWTVLGLRELGRMYQPTKLPWTCSSWSPLMELEMGTQWPNLKEKESFN